MIENHLLYGLDFGERLRILREECGLTQDVLALATGIERSTLAHYESGRVIPSIGRMRRIATALCLSMDDMLETTEYNGTTLCDSGFQGVDNFFEPKEGEASHAADIAPDPSLPDSLGNLTPEEQLLVLYFRQLQDYDKTQIMAEVSIISERTQQALYGADEEDIFLTEEEYLKKQKNKNT